MLHLEEISAYITCFHLPLDCQWPLAIPQDPHGLYIALWLGLEVYYDCVTVKKQNIQPYPTLLKYDRVMIQLLIARF